MKLTFLSALTAILITSVSIAQSSNPQFSADEIKRIEKQAKEYVKTFTSSVAKLAMTDDIDLQKTLKANIENLFIPHAKIEVMNLSEKKNTYSLSDYLSRIVAKYNERFGLVIVRFENIIINHNNFQPLKNSAGEITGYRGTYSFVQTFCVTEKNFKKEGIYKIEDFEICEKTTKEGEFITKKIVSPTAGERWVLLLGNVHTKQIENLKK